MADSTESQPTLSGASRTPAFARLSDVHAAGIDDLAQVLDADRLAVFHWLGNQGVDPESAFRVTTDERTYPTYRTRYLQSEADAVARSAQLHEALRFHAENGKLSTYHCWNCQTKFQAYDKGAHVCGACGWDLDEDAPSRDESRSATGEIRPAGPGANATDGPSDDDPGIRGITTRETGDFAMTAPDAADPPLDEAALAQARSRNTRSMDAQPDASKPEAESRGNDTPPNDTQSSDRSRSNGTLVLDVKEISGFAFPDGTKAFKVSGPEANGRDDRTKKAILPDDLGRKLEAAVAHLGTDLSDTPARVTLEGRWRKRSWTGRDEKQRTAWEFRADGFTCGDVVARATRDAARDTTGEQHGKDAAAKTEAGARKPMKSLDLVIANAEIRHSVSGHTWLVMTGRDMDGKRRLAVAWNDDARAMSDAIGQTLADRTGQTGWIDDANQVRVALKGNWKKKSFTDQQGKARDSWEFVVREFSELMRHQAEPAREDIKAGKSPSHAPEMAR